jgi:hypothetical protein
VKLHTAFRMLSAPFRPNTGAASFRVSLYRRLRLFGRLRDSVAIVRQADRFLVVRTQ